MIDENLPIRCRHWFPEHVAETVQFRGWKGVQNGALLELAVRQGYTVFLTCDRAIRLEIPPALLAQIAVVVLPSNDWQILKGLAEDVTRMIPGLVSGMIVDMAWPTAAMTSCVDNSR